MLPRWHILLGAILTLIIWLFAPEISFLYLALLFLSSFLIDFDHYAVSGIKTGKWGLKDSFQYHEKLGKEELKELKKGIRRKGDFHLFHTVEFHIAVGLLGILWGGFFFIFIGMFFHSLLDVFWLLNQDLLHRREFFLANWVRRKKIENK